VNSAYLPTGDIFLMWGCSDSLHIRCLEVEKEKK